MENNEIEIDEDEALRQMRADLLKGPNVQLEIINGSRNINEPYVRMKIKKASVELITLSYITIRETLNKIEEEYPFVLLLQRGFEVDKDRCHTIEREIKDKRGKKHE